MDNAVKRYKARRKERIEKKNGVIPQFDSVEEYKKRREGRLRERMDAGIGWVFGALKSNGVDTEGMSVDDAFEAWNKLNGKKNGGKKEENGPKKVKNGNLQNEEVRGSTYTKSFKTSGGVDYPKPKRGAVYDEDTLKEVNRLADEAGDGNQPSKTKQQEEVLKNLTSKDLVYQKDPDGTVVAAIPGLSQMWDKKVIGKGPEVQAAYDKRIEGGKKIGADMVEISNKLGSRMMGLENMFKGGGSTARKIDKVKKKYADKNLTDEEALGMMDDVVRFSFKCDHDKMVDQITGLEDELKKSGYEITERDNKFLPDPKGGPRNYKAVHLQVKAPSGELFEVQVQSEETIKVKNKNHRHFEKQRAIDLKEHPEMKDEYDRLEKTMVDNVNEMSEPPGIMNLPTFKKKK